MKPCWFPAKKLWTSIRSGEPCCGTAVEIRWKTRSLAVERMRKDCWIGPLSRGFPVEGYSAGSWQGIIAPAKIPADIVNRLHNEVKRIIALPDIADKLTSLGSRPQAKTPQETASWLASEKDKWARVVKETGLKID